jgi:hypothetical protein
MLFSLAACRVFINNQDDSRACSVFFQEFRSSSSVHLLLSSNILKILVDLTFSCHFTRGQVIEIASSCAFESEDICSFCIHKFVPDCESGRQYSLDYQGVLLIVVEICTFSNFFMGMGVCIITN